MSTAQTMQTIAITTPGGPDVLQVQQVPMPVCGPGEVLIRVAAAGVNGPDLAQRRGHYDPPPGASPIPGLEVSGEVVELGQGVTNFQRGERVMALTNGGGYAHFVAVPAGQVLPVPSGWLLTDAAAIPETWFTITQTLVMRAGLSTGMTVLVHGAAGGIGSAAIQIASVLGAQSIAVVSSPAKADYARSLGAMATIDYTQEDVAERALEITLGKGVDRVVDVVGGAMAEHNIRASAQGGHIVQVSTLDGATAPVSLRTIMARQLTLSGSTLRPQSSATKAAIASHIRRHLLPALSSHGFTRQLVTAYPFNAANRAHATMEARSHMGKLVLVTPFGATL
ncbi:NAD(P)H-quinone oxidoreductase [Devosia aquimaris]|uniref:NAD(P)H-quinone oxidoreductase n=1 Tax=Devosia aquimaris TaxID=2866214 RepID=UPI001CD1010C|nr:NAD(P)H-quinone oxidoreductase [Devosia sp. CJK-A8-3]